MDASSAVALSKFGAKPGDRIEENGGACVSRAPTRLGYPLWICLTRKIGKKHLRGVAVPISYAEALAQRERCKDRYERFREMTILPDGSFELQKR